ncbi:MAG TPA: 50S ribosomal protein L30 [Solirubrobacterales bacterium]|nr:50S ribosomal protein L30 [Solirubrobacterales bacterium]
MSVRQVRSANGANPRQRDTLRSLRLGRIGREAQLEDSPQLRGMLRVVEHLVEVDDGSGDGGKR